MSSVTLACARMGWNVHDTEVISLVTAQPAHRGAPRRPGDRAVERPVHAEGAGGAAQRAWPRRLRVQRARTTRRPGRTPPRRHRTPMGRRRARGHRRPQRDRRPLPARRTHVAIARRRVRPRRPDHQTRNPGGDLGGAGSRGPGSGCGTSARARAASRSNGAAAGAAALRWRSNATSSAAATSASTPRRSASDIDVRGEAPDAFDGAATPSAIFIGGGLTQPGLLDACLDNLPAGGRLVANAVTAESEAVLAQAYSRFGGAAATLPALSGRTAGRLHRLAPAATRSPSGR